MESHYPSSARRGGLSRSLVIAATVGAIFWIGLNLGLSAYWHGRFFPGTRVGSSAVGGMTRAQAQAAVKQQAGDYQLQVTAGNSHTEVATKDIGVEYDLEATLDAAFSVGRESYWPTLGLWSARKAPATSMAYRLRREVLADYAGKIAAAEGRVPVDASVVIEKGEAKIVPDQPGVAVDSTELTQKIEKAISLQQKKVTAAPRNLSADVVATTLAGNVTEAKQLMAVPLELVHGGRVFKADQAEIGSWITFTKTGSKPNFKLKTEVDKTRLKKFIQSTAKQIDKAPIHKKVTVRDGQATEERPGQEGLAMNQEGAVAAVSQALAAVKPLKYEVETKPVAYKTEYNRTVSLDYGRYIEINLSTQRLWAYQDKQMVYSSALTSGAAGAGYETITGLFSVKSKERNRYLNGRALGPRYNYNVFVQYWMPFSGNYGMHDASWRRSFGGPDYYLNGSKGCVNLPLAAAAWIYNWASIGTPVWVHK